MGSTIFEKLHAEAELNAEQVAKNEMIKLERETIGCTHSPYISERSRSVGRMRTGEENIFERLYPGVEEEDDEDDIIVTKV